MDDGSKENKSNFFCCGLQNFTPQPETYDIIWCQWVLGQLTDTHLIEFFKRCRSVKSWNQMILQGWILSPPHLNNNLLKLSYILIFYVFSLGLRNNGIIVVKENITSSGEVEMDDIDSSVTRPDGRFHYIFKTANLEVIREIPQRKFPQELYNVKMYALKPKLDSWSSPLSCAIFLIENLHIVLLPIGCNDNIWKREWFINDMISRLIITIMYMYDSR